MPRWEPDAPERLVGAALELFVEQGYDETTVAQIAERAGLTKSTFFRHFPDKREVLFFGQEVFYGLLTDGILSATGSATPLEAVAAGLGALEAVFTPERHPFAAQRQAVIAANSELQEREAMKRMGMAAAITRALHQRGVSEPTASLAAELGLLGFRDAFARWTDPNSGVPYAEVLRQSLKRLQAANASLAATSAG